MTFASSFLFNAIKWNYFLGFSQLEFLIKETIWALLSPGRSWDRTRICCLCWPIFIQSHRIHLRSNLYFCYLIITLERRHNPNGSCSKSLRSFTKGSNFQAISHPAAFSSISYNWSSNYHLACLDLVLQDSYGMANANASMESQGSLSTY